MRVCFVRSDPAPVELARALQGLGSDDVVVAERAPEGRFDVAIACDWRACASLFDVDAARYAALLVSLEYRQLDPERPERIPALLMLDLPLDFFVTSAWVERALHDVRPSARAWRVRLGRPDALASPASADGGPLRVAGAAPDVLAAMQEPVEAVETASGPHVVVSLRDYADPFSRPVSPLTRLLDGFAAGATAVAARNEGRDELVVGDRNGVLLEPDDGPGAARVLDQLARDRALLARLRAGAAQSAAEWPTWADAGRELRAAIERVLEAEPPPAAGAGELMRHALAETAKLSAYESARRDAQAAQAGSSLGRAAKARLRHPRLRPLAELARRLRRPR